MSHASKLPLTTWFQAIYLVTQNKNNTSALSLKRHIGVAYGTAWRVKHKLLVQLGAVFLHRFSLEVELVSAVYEAVEDRIGQGRIAEALVPVRDR